MRWRPRAPAPAWRRTRSSISSALGRLSFCFIVRDRPTREPLKLPSLSPLPSPVCHQRSLRAGCLLAVQGEVELKHIDARLSQHKQRAAFGVLIDHGADLVFG